MQYFRENSASVSLARLGYTATNWGALDRALREQHLTQPGRLVETTRHGRKFEIRAILKGPSGQSAIVLSAWMIRTSDSVPRFVTAYPGEEQ
jgi:hypothetical protein